MMAGWVVGWICVRRTWPRRVWSFPAMQFTAWHAYKQRNGTVSS